MPRRMKQTRKRVQQSIAEAEEDVEKGKYDHNPKHVSDQEMEALGVLTWRRRRMSDKDMDSLQYNGELPQRKIYYGGGGADFVTQLADDFVCVTSFLLTGHLILILGRAIELTDNSTYRSVHQWARAQHACLYLILNAYAEMVSFLVRHNVDFDPLKQQHHVVLAYIYTYPKYRKPGYATSLLKHIKRI